MADKPQFIPTYRQETFDFKASFHNTLQMAFAAGAKGWRIHVVALANEGDKDIEVQFG